MGGILGVNIMVVTRRYEDYVKAAVEAGIDLIISGAGLPMKLPELVAGSLTKIAPIVSGRKALEVMDKQAAFPKRPADEKPQTKKE